MKASRLLSILMLLQSRGRLTATALADELQVSERTILRDIDQLSAAGVPLWGERGRHGGFQLRPGWTTQLTGLTEAESQALLLAGLPEPATALGLGEAALSTRLKLLASVPPALRERAATVAERLHIDAFDWYREADRPAFLREAADAVWRSRCIVVDYSSWRGRSRRVLEPLGLVLKAGAWYLVAREAGQAQARTYRLASVLSLAPGTASFRRPRGFDLAGHWREAAAHFESTLRPLRAQVLASPRALRWLEHARSRFDPWDGVPAGCQVPAGWRALSLPIESIEHGARQMLGYGDELQVIAPPALRREVCRLAAGVLQRHGAGTHG